MGFEFAFSFYQIVTEDIKTVGQFFREDSIFTFVGDFGHNWVAFGNENIRDSINNTFANSDTRRNSIEFINVLQKELFEETTDKGSWDNVNAVPFSKKQRKNSCTVVIVITASIKLAAAKSSLNFSHLRNIQYMNRKFTQSFVLDRDCNQQLYCKSSNFAFLSPSDAPLGISMNLISSESSAMNNALALYNNYKCILQQQEILVKERKSPHMSTKQTSEMDGLEGEDRIINDEGIVCEKECHEKEQAEHLVNRAEQTKHGAIYSKKESERENEVISNRAETCYEKEDNYGTLWGMKEFVNEVENLAGNYLSTRSNYLQVNYESENKEFYNSFANSPDTSLESKIHAPPENNNSTSFADALRNNLNQRWRSDNQHRNDLALWSDRGCIYGDRKTNQAKTAHNNKSKDNKTVSIIGSHNLQASKIDPSATLFVPVLPRELRQSDLLAKFSVFGKILSIKVVERDAIAFAFIYFQR